MIVDDEGRKLELATSWEIMDYFNALRNLNLLGNEQTYPNPNMTNPDKHYLFIVYDTENLLSNNEGRWRVLPIICFC